MADGAGPNGANNGKNGSPTDPIIQENLDHWQNSPTVISRLKSLFGNGGASTNSISEALQEGDETLGVSHSRREMIERVIAFDTKQVLDVMIPRADIVAVERETDLPSLLQAFSDAGHSRLPVFRGELDDPIGMVHIRDLVGILADPRINESSSGKPVLDRLVRKIIYVPPSMPITDLLLRMQANRIHMALVIDEYGGTDGLVTIEDLVEEIGGDIQDEHDEDEAAFLKRLTPHIWEARARLPLEELEETVGVHFDLDEDEVDTLGGLVFTLAGRVPLRGEVICHPEGLEFEVLEADPRRIRKIKIRKLQEHEKVEREQETDTGVK